VAPRGYSVLEVSRFAGIPHPSVCGGRGRCTTCRVRVERGQAQLPPPSAAELAVLKRIRASADVRLACQLRPTSDVSVVPVLPAGVAADDALAELEEFAGQELEICVLFADLRAFTRFSERKLPYDIVYFLNRYLESMSCAIEQAGGIANQFTGDGVMALFGVKSGAAQGCRDALKAAGAMARGIACLSAEFAGELDAPLRMGIGVHAGWAVVGMMGRGTDKYLTAVGDTVHVASRLQDLTRQYDCALIVSHSAAAYARLDVARHARREIAVRNRNDRVAVYVVGSAERLAFSGA
jgi:adenylate cyclase